MDGDRAFERALIKNPLKRIPKDKLLVRSSLVNDFCQNNGFSDRVPLFQKAALVAQDPTGYDFIEELGEKDRHHLRREINSAPPLALYYAIFITFLGSAIQYDNTGANGANLSFTVEFGIAHNTWLVGAINSACVFPVLGQGFTHNWWELLICRMLLEIGIKITTIPIFSFETAPASIRGGLVMSFQVWVAFGIFIGFCSNLVFYRIGPLAWRFRLAAAFAPAVPLLLLVWSKLYVKSFNSFCRLRNSELQAARDLEDLAFGQSTFFGRIRDLFVVPRLQRATLGSWVAGYSVKTALLISLGFGAVNFTFLALDNAVRLPLIATFVFVFTAFYSHGIGPVPNVYAAECFPLSHRETGVAWTFCFYGGLNLLAFIMIFFLLPETKQRTLEELDFIFAIPTKWHASYQAFT
ncbi:hypothetical protein B0H17DRAFT_1162099 [Mycena rosella]|uniref:Major facilitator superfamily (MFS) profile domain-containing protein n=1 Tax=Mycena rosella TaxID=1033263 RepID=A0AAD7D3A1_MYCRO|nr:hypothetical protein B0H17DRAFT_1162099 [Mycena rosella]